MIIANLLSGWHQPCSCCVCYVFTPYFIDRFEMNGIAAAMIAGQAVAVLLLTARHCGYLLECGGCRGMGAEDLSSPYFI